MKLRTQILSLGLAGALAAALTGGVGLLETQQTGQHLEEALDAASQLQASQSADMMHDAIRGDAQLALLGVLQKRPEAVEEAAKDLKQHAKTLHEALARLRERGLSPEAGTALTAALPVVDQYIAAAELAVSAARSGGDPTQQAQQQLQALFTDLEGRLDKLSEAIEEAGQDINGQAQASVQRAIVVSAIALAAATLAMVLGALALAGRMTRPMAQAVAAADRLAAGDLGSRIESSGNDETQALLQSLARMQGHIAGMVRDVQRNAEQVAGASAQIAQGNLDLSGRTEQQAASLQQTAATMDELGSTVRNNADSARQANDLVRSAAQVAREGGAITGQVIDTMKGISDSAKRIAEIIGVIDGIAFQTNILALNAAVEAARAGEQGRGFAVVAGEVRTLAQRSGEASREIRTLITDSVKRVEQGSQLVDSAGRTMDEIVRSIDGVTQIVGAISQASAEQSHGVSQVGEAVSHMDSATQQNAALVEQGSAAAESLRQQAQDLVRAVSAFKLAGSPVG